VPPVTPAPETSSQEQHTEVEINQPHIFGSDLQIIDEDENDTGPSTLSTATAPETAPQRYPTRTHRPPARFGDFVRH